MASPLFTLFVPIVCPVRPGSVKWPVLALSCIISRGKVILGILPDSEYGTAEEQLAPGNRWVLYTDGITEAEAPDGALLDPEGFAEILKDLSDQRSCLPARRCLPARGAGR